MLGISREKAMMSNATHWAVRGNRRTTRTKS